MNKKKVALVIIVFALLCVGSYYIFEPGRNVSFHEVNLTNSCSASLPISDKVSAYSDNLDIYYYSDFEYDINITLFNNQSPITGSQGMLRFNNIQKETLGPEKLTEGNFTYYKNNKNGTYSAFVKDDRSHNFILISTSDYSMLNKIYNSLKARVLVEE